MNIILWILGSISATFAIPWFYCLIKIYKEYRYEDKIKWFQRAVFSGIPISIGMGIVLGVSFT